MDGEQWLVGVTGEAYHWLEKEGTHGKLWLVGVTIEGGHWSERTVSVVIVGWLVSRARVVLGKKRTSCAATLVWLLGWQAHWFVRK